MSHQAELEFRTAQGGATQNEKLRAYLLARPRVWLPMTELAEHIRAFAVHSRVADLRRKGLTIHNRSRIAPDGQRHSFYYYDPNPAENKPVPELR